MLSVAQILSEKRLETFLGRHGDDLPLAEGALVLALEAHPSLAAQPFLDLLDEMAAKAADLGAGAGDALESIRVLNHFLFTIEGFSPNQDDYYDERNSYFNEVLLRRTGIPVTLSVLYIDLARRLGLDVYGVGLPGHFMVGFQRGHETYFVDTFRQGQVLNHDRCRDFFHSLHEGRVRLRQEYLTRIDTRSILVRMLQNLKYIHLREHRVDRALCALNRVLLLDPGAWHARRERAMLCLRHDFHARALLDLRHIQHTHPEEAQEFKAIMNGLERKLLWQN